MSWRVMTRMMTARVVRELDCHPTRTRVAKRAEMAFTAKRSLGRSAAWDDVLTPGGISWMEL